MEKSKLNLKSKLLEYIILSVIIVLSLGGASAMAGDWGYGVVIANGGLNMRTSASVAGDVILVIPDSTVISVNAMTPDGRWYDVTYSGIAGYVSSDYLSLRSDDIVSRGKYIDRSRTSTPVSEASSASADAASGTSVANTDETVSSIIIPEDNGAQICEYASKFLGTPYLFGGTTPDGFDCSGFVQYVFSQFGYNLPRTATEQCEYLSVTVDKTELAPGDLLFFKLPGSSKPIGHVGIYVGDGLFIHATSPGDVIKYGDINSSYYIENYVTAKRLFA